MKKASITEAKNGLSALIDKVKHGETYLITDRGIPVARLAPVIGEPGEDDDARIARLERKGLIRRGLGKRSGLIMSPPPKGPPGWSIVEAVLEERKKGR